MNLVCICGHESGPCPVHDPLPHGELTTFPAMAIAAVAFAASLQGRMQPFHVPENWQEYWD